VFKKEYMKDVTDVIDIEKMITDKIKREEKVRDLLRNIKW
jgi:hypothetical protein